MAELIIDDWDLVVRLTLGEKIWSFHGDIRVRLPSIVSVASDPKPWLGLRGWRMAGISFTGFAVLGIVPTWFQLAGMAIALFGFRLTQKT